ncbi:MAG: hydroxyisourate hydrolase [Thalassobium sp.]|nr:MAG: hydroxyisourate hydrolase [Thalassobium sp.]
MQKSVITTHILDTQRGRPAVGVEVTLYRAAGADISAPDWQHMATACTNDDGRIIDWLGDQQREKGLYRLVFACGDYYQQQGLSTLYPQVEIVFEIDAPDEHYHIPLLLSANGYSTYRGS